VWSFVFLELGEQKSDAESKDDNQESHKIHKESLSLLLAVRWAEEKKFEKNITS
jgi:hypothetical protein